MTVFLPTLSSVGLVIGSSCLLHYAYKAIQFYTLYIRAPSNPLQNYKLKTPPVKDASDTDNAVAWALVTGSSGGIGFGYAHYLLSLGFGVILHAHKGVSEAESQLRKAYPNGAIKSLILDCTTASLSDIEALVQKVQALPITILINNVGGIPLASNHFRPFLDFDAAGIDAHWKLNARFMTHLTRLMIPLLNRNAQPRSLILNVTSAGRVGVPYISLYSATKGYVTSFSHALTRECRLFGYAIDCLCIVPGDVLSTGNSRGVALSAPMAGEYAKCVLERVDGAVGRGLVEISPYWKHALQLAAMEWIPESVLARETTKVVVRKREAWMKEE